MKSIDQELVTLDNDNTLSPSIHEDKKCCCFNIAYFPIAKIYVCNHWIVKPIRPLIIIVLFLYLLFTGCYDSIVYIPNKTISYIFLVIFILIALALAFAYFSTIIASPGYLPYDYAHYSDLQNLTWENLMDSIVTYQEQLDYARQSKRPPRSSFSVLARRFVLRADHYCYWTESWIGIKNQRYFMLTLSWADLFVLAWFLVHIWWFRNECVNYQYLHLYIYLGIVIGFIAFCSATYYLLRAVSHVKHNLTSIEIWKKSAKATDYDKGCFNNFAEVCGEKKYCPLWFCPCVPLEPVENGLYEP
ncbi:DHHC zinc finger domain containing protein [Histomonas meleagridis]|uniref:DHHC zinc finger domain containing protein n=1 Tax=Histomonas meleagridis TaxID=135588 RepID=UPI00355966D9|nr:DHHC zinc finger domain containing protein [Histomonas meleagridis]KAH0803237.1 DHHC zinc finger domain containing protein [Histomonas meleagridis]